MKGYKTWIAAIGTILLGISDLYENNYDLGMQKIMAGLALIGLGHKLEKR